MNHAKTFSIVSAEKLKASLENAGAPVLIRSVIPLDDATPTAAKLRDHRRPHPSRHFQDHPVSRHSEPDGRRGVSRGSPFRHRPDPVGHHLWIRALFQASGHAHGLRPRQLRGPAGVSGLGWGPCLSGPDSDAFQGFPGQQRRAESDDRRSEQHQEGRLVAGRGKPLSRAARSLQDVS
jgi:hypothetical protein